MRQNQNIQSKGFRKESYNEEIGSLVFVGIWFIKSKTLETKSIELASNYICLNNQRFNWFKILLYTSS